ncbi:hypothetical protein COW64_25830, partial [bacterium (Candidatus Blackallbacteria) CG18_big_fil_WC_8_21_14_2_50_49_26]
MQSARQLPVTYIENSYGGATRDYTSLNVWESDTDTNLVTEGNGKVLSGYKDFPSYDDEIFLGGANTNASYFRAIQPAPGEGHTGVPGTGFKIAYTGATDRQMNSFDHYFRAHDIEFTRTANSQFSRRIFFLARTNCKVVGCLLYDGINTGAGRMHGICQEDDKCITVDSLIKNMSGVGIVSNPDAGFTSYIYNCTLQGNGLRAVDHSSGTTVCKNVLANANVSNDFNAGTYTGSSNNASSDATAPGT